MERKWRMEDPVAHDVFISFSSKDAATAQKICQDIEQFGIACWISSRDIGPGEDFQDSIISALEQAKVVLLVFSENANQSRQIKKELTIASDYDIPIMPVRIEDVYPTQGIKYQLTTRQYIDLFGNWGRNIQRVVDAIIHGSYRVSG